MKKHGFTLIELLVVVAIIALLGAIVLVSMQSSRGKATLSAGKQFESHLRSSLGAYAAGIWRFEESSGNTAIDESNYGNNGTLNGGATRVANDELGGSALSFDGADDYVSIPDNAILRPATFTISMWIKWNTATSGSVQFITGKNTTDYEFQVGGLTNPGDIRFIPAGWGPSNVDASKVLNTGWNFITGVYTKTESSIYVNGVLKATRTGITGGNDLTTDAAVFNIGRRAGGGSSYFNGIIDEVRIFSSSLSVSEIQKLYAEGLALHQ